MKKIKIVLVAVAVWGMIGGALAFKAKKFGSSRCCAATTGAAGNLCPVILGDAPFDVVGGPILKYTPRPAGNCINIPCLATGRVNP